MSNRTTQFDTQHDYQPTFSRPPADVQVAKDKMEAAWDAYYLICEECEDGRMGRDELQFAAQVAQEAEQVYKDVYAAWQREGGMSA